MYKFSIWDFDDKEVDQIVQLVTAWATGKRGTLFNQFEALDRRKITKAVFEWSKSRQVIQLGKHVKQYDYKSQGYIIPRRVKKCGVERWYIGTSDNFSPLYDLPVEAIYRLCKNILDNGSGFYTITSNSDWRNFGIWCSKDRQWNTKDGYQELVHGKHLTNGESRYIPFIKNVLNKLAIHGYLIFQYAGSIWQVTMTLDRAYRDG
jgi:hypothetical protein